MLKSYDDDIIDEEDAQTGIVSTASTSLANEPIVSHRQHGTIDGITTATIPNQETKSFWKMLCPDSTLYRISLLVLVIGLLLIVLGLVVIHPPRYVCGSHPPSAEEIQARGAPVCLTTSVRPDAMCLEAGLDPNEPGIWCQEKMAKYYLWWTSSDGSWRMSKDIWEDPSAYMAWEPNQPKPHDAPLNYTWLEYTRDQQQSTVVPDGIEISECPLDDVNEDGIPNACFADTQIPLVWIVGLVLVILSAVFCWEILFGTEQEGSDRHTSPGRRRDISYYWGNGDGCS